MCLRKLSALFDTYERYEGQGTEFTFTEADFHDRSSGLGPRGY
jgi:hypothetical protein